MPWLLFKVKICEKFGWTFNQFDEAPADELLQGLSLENLYIKIKTKSGDDDG